MGRISKINKETKGRIEKMKDWLKLFSFIIGMILFIIISMILIQFLLLNDKCCMCGAGPGCCPCPNNEYFHEVEEYFGYDASGAGSWLEMCEQYKQETNKTFYCFE